MDKEPLNEYTDDKWITRDIPDPESANPLELTDQLGNKIGNGFVSPETGRVCIDLHGKNKGPDPTIEAVEFYLDGKLVKEWSINKWNPELTCSEPFNRAVVTYGPPRRTIITLCEPVAFEGVKICRKE